jgi:hypothetical protein
MENTIDQVVDAYGEFLYYKMGQAYAERYTQQIEDNAIGAKAEAAIFSWLYWNHLDVKVNEHPKTGGADFLCRSPKGNDFILEVTTIQSDRVDRESHFPGESESGGAYGLITKELKGVIETKLRQVDKYPLPRVVAVASDHRGADLLLGAEAARCLLISDWGWTTIITTTGNSTTVLAETRSTDLMKSTFLQPDQLIETEIELIFDKISAALLVPISHYSISPVGVIHPQAKYPFDSNDLPLAPWIYLKEWPVVDGKIIPEWTRSPEYSWWLKRIRMGDRRP